MADAGPPSSPQDLLARRLENTEDPAMERVERELSGKVAFPRPGDYLAVLGSSGQEVLVLDVLVPTVDRLTVRRGERASRHYPEADRFEFVVAVDGDVHAGPLGYQDARRLVDHYDADLALESERRDLYEKAQPASHAHASLTEVWDFIPDA